MAIRPISGRQYTIKLGDTGDILELGPAAVQSAVGTWSLGFNASVDFVGSLTIQGKTYGTAALNTGAPFMNIPYRRVSLANVAQAYEMVSDPIVGAALILVPANGLSVGILVACSAGQCVVTSWDLNGSSAV